MSSIKPIETVYNGYRFRSRLEARWAVFFDTLKVNYEYEPEGFELPSGNYYLPDFRIKCYGTRGDCTFDKCGFTCWGEPHCFDLYVEVKGEMTQKDADKIIEFAKEYPILIVGNIPDPIQYTANSDDLHCYDRMNGIDIYPWNYELIDDDHFGAYPAVDAAGHFYLDGDDSHYTTVDPRIICNAFKAARQARFEHGEHGAVS